MLAQLMGLWGYKDGNIFYLHFFQSEKEDCAVVWLLFMCNYDVTRLTVIPLRWLASRYAYRTFIFWTRIHSAELHILLKRSHCGVAFRLPTFSEGTLLIWLIERSPETKDRWSRVGSRWSDEDIHHPRWREVDHQLKLLNRKLIDQYVSFNGLDI